MVGTPCCTPELHERELVKIQCHCESFDGVIVCRLPLSYSCADEGLTQSNGNAFFLFTVIYLVIWSVIPDHYLLYTCLFFCLFRKPQSLEFIFCLQCHKMYFIGGFIKVLIGKVSLRECTDVL